METKAAVQSEALNTSAGASRPSAIPQGSGAAILRALAVGEQNVTALVRATDLSQSNVSNHLARFRAQGLVLSRRTGRQILYRLADPSLAPFLLGQGERGTRPASTEEAARSFLEAVLSLREEVATRTAYGALAAGLEWRDLYLGVFAPALVEVGRRWEAGELDVSEEHLITGMVLRLIHRLSLSVPAAPEAGAPSALVGCVEGELHTVGGRMLADFLLADGWRVWYMNGNVPLPSLLDAVGRCAPDAVLLSIATADREPALRDAARQVAALRGDLPVPFLAAGGRYFQQPRAPIEGLDLAGSDLRTTVAALRQRIDTASKRALTPPPAAPRTRSGTPPAPPAPRSLRGR